jgi:hypothetical protein
VQPRSGCLATPPPHSGACLLAPLCRRVSQSRDPVNSTPKTRYLEAVSQLAAFLTAGGVDLPDAGRTDLEAFLAGLLAHWKPATAANRDRALRVFYA